MPVHRADDRRAEEQEQQVLVRRLARVEQVEKQIPRMASIQTWRRTGGDSEFRAEGAPPDARGIADERGRLMVVMVHNSDIPDGWEREGEDREYFFRFSPDAYAVGMDIVLYAMSH